MNVLDTGIIIQMLKEKRHKQGFISPITLIETLRGIDSRKRTKIKELLEESFYLLNIDNEIIEKYCEVYSKLKKEGNLLPDADLLIGATAMAKSIPLETNDEHFQRLERLGLKTNIISVQTP
jgi:predicted nucleic acid-binding protein